MQEAFDKNYTNVEITFFDHSIAKENPSCKLVIDGQEVYLIDSISKSLYQDTEINLKMGKHLVVISTKDDQFKMTDTIIVEKYPIKYKLWIRYNYNPPLDEYREIIITEYFQRSIKDKDYTDDQKADILRQVTEKINQEFEDGVTYNPSERHFTLSFKDITHYPIE